MKTLLVILISSFSYFAYPQYHTTYDWEETPTAVDLTEAELKESSIAVFERSIIEFSAKTTGENQKFETTHTLVHVNDEKGIQSHNRVYIPMYNVLGIISIKARTINAQGEVKLFDDNNIREIQNVEQYGDFKIFALEGVEKGGKIEVLYTVEKGYYPFGSEGLQDDYPKRSAEFLFIYGDLIGRVKAYNTDTEFEAKLVDGKKAQHLVLENIPALVEEEYATYNANTIKVSYQCYGNSDLTDKRLWGNVVGNITRELFPKIPNALVVEELNTLLKDLDPNDYQKASILDNHLKTSFTIIENNNEQLEDIDYILKNRSANDLGIVKAYAQFLTSAGISYEIVITSNRYEHTFDPTFFDPRALREYLIYIPTLKQYIAPDRIDYRIGEAPFGMLGNYGVFVNNKTEYDFREITQNDPEYSRIYRRIDVGLDDTMEKVRIEEYQEYYGHWSTTNRAVLTLGGQEMRSEFEDYLTGYGIESKAIEDFELENSDPFQPEYNTPFVVKSTITSESLLEDAGDSYLFEIGKVIGLQSELYQEKERINPIEMQYPNRYNYTITMPIPEGYTLEGLSSLVLSKRLQPTEEEFPLCSFESNYELKDGALVITIEEIYRQNSMPKKYYEEFRSIINAASDFNKATIVLTME